MCALVTAQSEASEADGEKENEKPSARLRSFTPLSEYVNL